MRTEDVAKGCDNPLNRQGKADGICRKEKAESLAACSLSLFS